jgi:hypothetical protein
MRSSKRTPSPLSSRAARRQALAIDLALSTRGVDIPDTLIAQLKGN